MTSVVNIVNTTPHEIVLMFNDEVKRFKPSGNGLRLIPEQQQQVDSILSHTGIPVVTKQNFIGFTWESSTEPPPEPGSILLVSMPVGEYFATHPDLAQHYTIIGPDTGPNGVIRDADGKIIGTRRFVLYAKPK